MRLYGRRLIQVEGGGGKVEIICRVSLMNLKNFFSLVVPKKIIRLRVAAVKLLRHSFSLLRGITVYIFTTNNEMRLKHCKNLCEECKWRGMNLLWPMKRFVGSTLLFAPEYRFDRTRRGSGHWRSCYTTISGCQILLRPRSGHKN